MSANLFTLGLLTRGRPLAALACAQSALARGDNVQVLIAVDDDRDTHDALVTHFEGNPRVRMPSVKGVTLIASPAIPHSVRGRRRVAPTN